MRIRTIVSDWNEGPDLSVFRLGLGNGVLQDECREKKLGNKRLPVN